VPSAQHSGGALDHLPAEQLGPELRGSNRVARLEGQRQPGGTPTHYGRLFIGLFFRGGFPAADPG